MTEWRKENIRVDTIHGEEFVIEINGERHILTEREADALMGELSIHGAKNPNVGRYNRFKRSGGETDA